MDEIREIEGKYPNTTCCNLICFAEKLQFENRIKELEDEFNKQVEMRNRLTLIKFEAEAKIKKLVDGIKLLKEVDGISDVSYSIDAKRKLYELVEKK